MSYSIIVGNRKQTIKACHNEDFTQAVEIFRLFDDSRINLAETREALKKMNPNFMIRFYWLDVTECIFDSFMFACFLKNKNLIKVLSQNYNSNNWNVYINQEYCFGSSNITPLAAICTNYNYYNDDERNILELFMLSGYCNFNQIDPFGERMITSEMENYARIILGN